MKLSEICEYTTKRIETESLGVDNYISTENMLQNKGGIVAAAKVPSEKAVAFYPGDVLISNIRPYFKKIWLADKCGGCSSDVLCLRALSGIDKTYLYYLLSQDSFFEYVMSGAKGSKMPRGDKAQIMNWDVEIPDINEQKRIGCFLKSIDDKILLNNRINHNLEEQAQALYKSWFVDFEPFKGGKFVDSELGMIPEGWRVGSIYDICDVYYGAPFNSSFFNSEKKGLPLIRIRDLVRQEAGVFTEEKHPKGQLAHKGNILVGMDGEFTIYIWGGENSWINQRISRFSPKPGISHYFLTETLRPQLKSVESSEVATTVIHIGKNDYDKFFSLIAPHSVLDAFFQVSEPLFLKYVENLSSSKELSKTRDLLLPKLMSGKLALLDINY